MTAKSLKHKFVSAVADGANLTLVKPSNWNDEHNFWLGGRTVTGASDALVHADHLSVIRYNSTSAIAVSLAAPSGGNMPLGWVVKLKNSNTGQVTVTIGGGTINGQPSAIVAANEALEIRSDGTSDFIGILTLATTSIAVNQTSALQIGLTGRNNATTPDSKFDFSVGEVVLRNASGGTIRRTSGSATCDLTVTGPAANGRDQSAGFSASTWLHFYWIYNRTTSTLATIVSTVAPPTGPTLPSGYTYWTYIGPIWLNVSSVLAKVFLRGSYVNYQAQVQFVNASSSTAEIATSISGIIPPNASRVRIFYQIAIGTAASNTLFGFTVSPITPYYAAVINAYSQTWGIVLAFGYLEMANYNQLVYWHVGSNLSTLNLYVVGYVIPNQAT